jgi:hypothetical protein
MTMFSKSCVTHVEQIVRHPCACTGAVGFLHWGESVVLRTLRSTAQTSQIEDALEAAAAEGAAADVAASSLIGLAKLHGTTFEKNGKGDRALVKNGKNADTSKGQIPAAYHGGRR